MKLTGSLGVGPHPRNIDSIIYIYISYRIYNIHQLCNCARLCRVCISWPPANRPRVRRQGVPGHLRLFPPAPPPLGRRQLTPPPAPGRPQGFPPPVPPPTPGPTGSCDHPHLGPAEEQKLAKQIINGPAVQHKLATARHPIQTSRKNTFQQLFEWPAVQKDWLRLAKLHPTKRKTRQNIPKFNMQSTQGDEATVLHGNVCDMPQFVANARAVSTSARAPSLHQSGGEDRRAGSINALVRYYCYSSDSMATMICSTSDSRVAK